MGNGTHVRIVKINGMNHGPIRQSGLGCGSAESIEENSRLAPPSQVLNELDDPAAFLFGGRVPGNAASQSIRNRVFGLFDYCRR